MIVVLIVIGCLFSGVVTASSEGASNADRINWMPGMESLPSFAMYSGYLDINVTTGKRFFYYLVEGVNATTQPLVRWFNGGPGCSSIGGGGFSENGPFIPDEQGNLLANPTSWNQYANMLYIESPVGVCLSVCVYVCVLISSFNFPLGVGFSYSKTNSDYTSSDASTAVDNYIAMQQFLLKYPRYAGRDLWLMGESYAGHYFFPFLFYSPELKAPSGHYIPTLVTLLLDNPLPFKFRGFATGNPTTSIVDDFFYGTWQTWAMRGLISQPTWEAIESECAGNITFLQPPPPCQSALNVAQGEMGNKFNPYDLDVPMCAQEEQRRMTALISKVTQSPPFLPYDPCEDLAVQTYLNRQDVQQGNC